MHQNRLLISKLPIKSVDEEQIKNYKKTLAEAIDVIFSQSCSKLSFEELYRCAYNLCIHKHQEELYDLNAKCIKKNLVPIAETIKSSPSNTFLEVLSKAWASFLNAANTIKDILMYLDKNYIAKKELLSVFDYSISLFRQEVIESHHLKESIYSSITRCYFADRVGEFCDRFLIREITQMLKKLGLKKNEFYEQYFESQFLLESRNYFKIISAKRKLNSNGPDFLRYVDNEIRAEKERCNQMLELSTLPKLEDILKEEMIKNHAEDIINVPYSGIENLINDNRFEDLKLEYEVLMQTSESQLLLKQYIGKLIKKQGMELIQNESQKKSPSLLIKNLISFREKYIYILENCLGKNDSFNFQIKESFENLMNMNNQIIYCLAFYVDEILKQEIKRLSEFEIENKLEDVIKMFRYIQSQDTFEAFYKDFLSKRLFTNSSGSYEYEMLMVKKLKMESGLQYTQKIETMFKDISVSQDLMKEFKKTIEFASIPFNLEVQVLTIGNWPIDHSVQLCFLPSFVENAKMVYTEFYMKKFTGRVITWKVSQGSCDVRAIFGNKKYEITMNPLQMCILDLFNISHSISFEDIVNQTKIHSNDLKKQILPLLIFKLLISNNESKEIKEEDVFTVNEKFFYKSLKLKIPILKPKNSTEWGTEESNSQNIVEKVIEDRSMLIDTTIIKIMKARKKISHTDLQAEVAKILKGKFIPENAAIKLRIEYLIEKEYIERSRDDKSIYIYKS